MTAPTDEQPTGPHPSPGPAFWVAMGLGAALSLFGAVGLLGADGNGLGSFIPWFAGGALVVDLVIVPTAAAIGLLGRRVVPSAAWPAVRAGLIASTTLTVFATPLLLNLGGSSDNPSLRPRHYGSGLLSALAAVWVVCLVMAVGAWLVDRRRPHRVAG